MFPVYLTKENVTIWAAPSEFVTYRLCEQRRFRRACASAQSRQNLRCSLIQAVSQEEPSDRKPDPWPRWMAGHAQLKFVMTECSKTQIRLTRPIWFLCLNYVSMSECLRAIHRFLLRNHFYDVTRVKCNHLISVTIDDIATIPFHPSLFFAALRESPNPIPVHSLMLSSHLFFCLPIVKGSNAISQSLKTF